MPSIYGTNGEMRNRYNILMIILAVRGFATQITDMWTNGKIRS
jgi:hypothetical protein